MLDKSNDGFVSYTEILPLINYLQKQKSEQERGKNISRDKFTKNKVSVSIDTKFVPIISNNHHLLLISKYLKFRKM